MSTGIPFPTVKVLHIQGEMIMANEMVCWVVNSKRAIKVTYRNSGWPWLKKTVDVGSKDEFPYTLTDGCSGSKGGEFLLSPDDEVIFLGREKSVFVPLLPIIGEVTLG